jgi:hypothetical protein
VKPKIKKHIPYNIPYCYISPLFPAQPSPAQNTTRGLIERSFCCKSYRTLYTVTSSFPQQKEKRRKHRRVWGDLTKLGARVSAKHEGIKTFPILRKRHGI